MTITFYNFTGREDLVDKTGSLGTAHAYTGTLRDGCSLMDPVIDMEFSGTFGYNYAYITEFARWYFVVGRDIIATNLWQVSMHEDVLMSWKGSNTAPKYGLYSCYGYITRSLVQTSGGTIVDGKYPQKANSTVSFLRPSGASPWASSASFLSNLGTGFHYIMFFAGYCKNGNVDVTNLFPCGAVAIQDAKIRSFSDSLSRDVDFIGSLTGKTFYDYITGFYWFPFNLSTAAAGSVNKLSSPGILSSDLNLAADVGKAPTVYHNETTWDISITPPGTVAKQYLCYPPYTRYLLTFLPFGSFELDAGYLWQENTIAGSKTVHIKAVTDVSSGDSSLYYSVDSSLVPTDWIYLGSANVGLKVPYVASSTNLIGAAASVIAGAASAALGSPAVIPSAASATFNALTPNVVSRNGTYNVIDSAPTIIVTTNATKDDAPSLYGYSDAAYIEIGSVSGFRVIDEVDIHGAYFQTADLTEINEIKEKLKKGVVL